MARSVWFISKYCKLPSAEGHPARAFSLLRELVRQGHDCTLITARHDWRLADIFRSKRIVRMIDGVRVIELRVVGYRRAKSLARIIGWLQFEWRLFWMRRRDLPRPDAVVASSLSLLSILNGFVIRRRTACKLIFEVRDVWPMILTENGGFSRSNPFVRMLGWVERAGYRYADEIVATMPNLRPHVAAVLGRDREVHCIPMGVPEELKRNQVAAFPAHLETVFPKDKFVVTHAGSIGIDNALDVLFDAARLLKDHPTIAFFVIGSGDLVVRYKALCNDLPNLIFAEPVPGSFVQPILRRSAVLYFSAHPTVVLQFGQSLNKVIDYMYAARPIVASFTGFPSMINEADCGAFVTAGDATALATTLCEFAERPTTELDEMGQRGRQWVLSNRSYATLAERYAAILG